MSAYLLPLELLGKDSWQQESLCSYLFRHAELHGVTASQLIQMINGWQVRQGRPQLKVCKTLFYTGNGHGMFSYRERMQTLVASIEVASGREHLQRATLTSFGRVLASQCRGTMRASRTWCPNCLAEDVQQERPVYDRLIWSLLPIRRCHVHRLRLRDSCPHCEKRQRFPEPGGRMSRCFGCHGDLLVPARRDEVMLEPTFGEKDCIELVRAISCGELDQVDPSAMDTFHAHLDRSLPPMAKVVSAIAERSGAARQRDDSVPPTLDTLLKKAYVTQCSVVSILTDPLGAAFSAGTLVGDASLMPRTQRPRQPSEVLPYVEQTLRELIAQPLSQPIPPLPRLAQELGVSQGYIRHRLPTLVLQYQHRRISASSTITSLKRQAIQRELVRLAQRSEGFASLHELERYLAAKITCSITLARHEIRKYRQAQPFRSGQQLA